MDGTCLDVPDSPANQGLGRSKSGRGEGVGAFPQLRVVGLVEAGTHAIITPSRGRMRLVSRPWPASWPTIVARWGRGCC